MYNNITNRGIAQIVELGVLLLVFVLAVYLNRRRK